MGSTETPIPQTLQRMSSTASGSPAIKPTDDFFKHIHSISRQSAVFLLGTLFTVAAGYLFKVYLARVLGAEGLGIYTLGMTAGGLVSIVGAAGVPQTASRFVAIYSSTGQVRKLGRFLWFGALTLLVTNALVGFAMVAGRRWIADRLYHTPVLAQYMHFFAAIMLLGALTTFLGQALAGYKDVARRTVITNFIGTPATMVISVALLTMGLGLWGYLAAQVVSALLVFVLLTRAVWKLTPKAAPQTLHASAPETGHLPLFEREVVSFAALLIGMQALEFISGQSDRIMLGIYLNVREVGIYSIAASMVAFVGIFLQSINQIFAPTIAELFAKREHDLLLRLYQALTKWTLGLTIPLALGIMIFAKPLMGIIGPDFREGWPVLAIATVGQLVNCGVGSVGFLLLMSDQQARMVRAQAITVFLTLGLNFLLIPRLGLIGAAIAAAATNTSLNVLWLRDVRNRLGLTPSLRGYASLLLPTALTILVLVLVRTFLGSHLPEILLLLVGLSAGYIAFALAALCFALEPQDKILAAGAYTRIRGMFTA
jgi:O-antigen/teichoic acid export membrane protein